MHGINVEVVEMDALPAHAHLQDAVQLVQRHGCRHQHAPPDHGADAQQAGLQLNDACGFFRARYADLMPSPAQICNCPPPPPPLFGTPPLPRNRSKQMRPKDLPGLIGPIILGTKKAGVRSAGNPRDARVW